MSKETPSAVLEWGPSHAVILNMTSRAKRASAEMADAAQILNGQRDVVAAVSRRAAFVRAIRVPDVSKEDVSQLLRLQLTGLFPVPEAELAYDFRLTSDVDADGRLAVIGAMRETDLLRLHADARANGLRVRRVLPAAFGSMVLARDLGLPTCAVVQLTAEGIAIDIIADGELRYTRLTPTTSDSLVIESEIQRTFAAAGVEPATVVATEGIHLPNAVDARMTTLEALGSAGAENLQVNLEPFEVVIAREKRKHGARVRLAGLLWIAALLFATPVYLDWSDQKDQALAVDKHNATLLAHFRTLRDGEQKKASESGRINNVLKQAFLPGQSLGDVLTLMTNDAPAGTWLTGVSLERGKAVSVRGISLKSEAISVYLTNLTNESDAKGQKRFRDVKLGVTNNAVLETKNVVQFSISAFPVGNVPVVDDKKSGSHK